MPRIPIAVLGFLIGFTLYVAAAVTLADRLGSAYWLGGAYWWLQALYFLVAGLLWTVPTRWLMLWAARR